MVIYLRRASPQDIARLKSDAAHWETFAFDEAEPGEIIDFDKAWDALHFLLTGPAGGADDALGIIAGGGVTYGSDENGFGGFTVISPDRMRAFDTALQALSDEDLAGRFDPASMSTNDIYLADAFTDDEPEEELAYIVQGVSALRKFSSSCAQAGDGALRIIS